MLKSFEKNHISEIITRIENLNPNSKALWGKMNVSQMLEHCQVPYKQIFNENEPKAPWFMRTLVRLFFKTSMTNEVPYKPNLPTAPNFLVLHAPEFSVTQNNLIKLIVDTQNLGETYFHGKHHPSLGKLSSQEWSNLLYKHIDHHLRQFGV